MATLNEIARIAGVSVGTVSNVLSGSAAVSEKKQKKVLEAAERLKYTPNFAARCLKKGESKIIGVLLQKSGPQSDAITETLIENGYYPMLGLSLGDEISEKQVISRFVSMGIAGMIVEICGGGSKDSLQQLSDRGIPVITLGSAVSGFESVTTDDRHLADMARRKYNALGRRGIILSRLGESSQHRECEAGYLEYGDIPVMYADMRDHIAYRQIMEIFNKLEFLPDVIYASDEALAVTAREICGLFNRGIHIVYPSDSLIEGDTMHPYLRNTSYLGSIAAERLMKGISDPPLKGKIVKQTDVMVQKLSHGSEKNLHIKLFDGPTASTLIQMLPPFTAQTGIEITYELLGYQELYSAVCGDVKRADLYMIDDSWINAVSGCFLPPQNIWSAGAILPHVRKAPVRPLMVNIQLLFYRKELFESPVLRRGYNRHYGLDLRPPRSWNEFLNVAEFFSESPDSPTKYGTTLQGMDAITIAEEFYPRQWSFGGKMISDTGEVSIDSAANVKALKNLCETYKCTPMESVTNDWEREGKRLQDGEIAMYFTFATHVPVSMDIGVAPAPGGFSVAGGWYLGVDKKTEKKDGAMELLEWATGAENAGTNTILGNFVPYPHILESEMCKRVHPWLQMVKKERIHEREHLLTKRGQTIDAFKIDTMLYEAVISACRGEVIPEIALGRLKNEIESL